MKDIERKKRQYTKGKNEENCGKKEQRGMSGEKVKEEISQ